jgi:hypothetical protein
MEVERRQWLRLAVGAGVALSAPLVWLARRAAPVRYVEAVRGRFCVGPRKHLDEAEVRKPGRWAG